MAKQFTVDRFKAILNHLAVKGEADLPKTAKHGEKGDKEDDLVQELINESEAWRALATSTVVTWIGHIEDIATEVKRAELNGKVFMGVPQCLIKANVKGVAEEGDFPAIHKGLLAVGKTIVNAQLAKQAKQEQDRKDAAEKAVQKRQLQAAATTSGKKKRSREDGGEEETGKKRRHRRSGVQDRPEAHEDSEDEEGNSNPMMRLLNKLLDDREVPPPHGAAAAASSSSSSNQQNGGAAAVADASTMLALEQTKLANAKEVTKQLEMRYELARLGALPPQP
jgi:hypothetical protein